LARIIELLTVNIAVESLEDAIPRYQALGLDHVAPAHMPEPPAQITDVSFPLSEGGAFSLIQATDPSSPVARFLEKRPPGPYSLAVRVDDLKGAMKEWGEKGMEWVLPDEPHVFENGEAVGRQVERLLMNWIKPKCLGGVMLEVFEFQGKVEKHD
jgi:4-hydroxyphenylpyruvate dioxygenase-like putative hemolysin